MFPDGRWEASEPVCLQREAQEQVLHPERPIRDSPHVEGPNQVIRVP